MLFLHGSGGVGLWTPFHAELAKYAAVITPDHPGFGGSTAHPALEDVQDLAFPYADLIARLGLDG